MTPKTTRLVIGKQPEVCMIEWTHHTNTDEKTQISLRILK